MSIPGEHEKKSLEYHLDDAYIAIMSAYKTFPERFSDHDVDILIKLNGKYIEHESECTHNERTFSIRDKYCPNCDMVRESILDYNKCTITCLGCGRETVLEYLRKRKSE